MGTRGVLLGKLALKFAVETALVRAVEAGRDASFGVAMGS